jgi:hypothetical protein
MGMLRASHGILNEVPAKNSTASLVHEALLKAEIPSD